MTTQKKSISKIIARCYIADQLNFKERYDVEYVNQIKLMFQKLLFVRGKTAVTVMNVNIIS